MSQVLTAARICEEALGAIGEFPVTSSAPDGEYLRRAMTWLDLNMAQLAGTTELFFIVPATISFTLTNGTSSYNLYSALGAELPLDRVQFPLRAWLEDAAGNRSPLDIVGSDVFEAVPLATETGTPTMIHIDRLPTEPRLRIYPTPAASDPATWTVYLDVQTYAPNVAPSGVTGTQPSSSVLTGFRQAWQRWLIFQLAADLASGPIIKLPKASLDEFRGQAKDAKEALLVFENKEHDTTDPLCEAWET